MARGLVGYCGNYALGFCSCHDCGLSLVAGEEKMIVQLREKSSSYFNYSRSNGALGQIIPEQ
jgi:hypothetical protein